MCWYDAIAKGYDELYGEEQMRKWRMVEERIKSRRWMKVLDVGCGTGLITIQIAKYAASVIGLDKSMGMLKHAHSASNVRYIWGDALNLPFPDKSFDLVVSLTVMQDIPRIFWPTFLGEVRRVARDWVVISILKRGKDLETLKMLFRSFFHVLDVVEEEKDYIFFLRPKVG